MAKESGEDPRLHDELSRSDTAPADLSGAVSSDGKPRPSHDSTENGEGPAQSADSRQDAGTEPFHPDNTQEDQVYDLEDYQKPQHETDASLEEYGRKDEQGGHHSGSDFLDEYHPDSEYHDAYDSGGGTDPVHEEEEGGGPVKTFLEHLEDLRWMLIKCVSAIIIGMVVCLVAGNKLITVLKAPLEKAKINLAKDVPMVSINLGTNKLGSFVFDTNVWSQIMVSNSVPHRMSMDLVPVKVGTNILLTLNVSEREMDDNERIVLKNYSPVGGFVVALQLGLYGGIGLASPFLLFFIGEFVLPALKRNEKKLLYRAVIYGGGLFVVGVLFCYYLLLPIALYAAANFSNWLNFQSNEWRAEDYISFISKFMLGMGISFELPVVILTLVKLNIVDYKQLSSMRPYWIVANMVLSSVLTPPDPFTMLLMALPLQCLYEISTFVAWMWYKKEKEEEAAAEAA